jgi:hypothetical protein
MARLSDDMVLKLRHEAIDAYVAATKKAADAKRHAQEAEAEAKTAEDRLTQLDAHDVTSLTRVNYGDEFYTCEGNWHDDFGNKFNKPCPNVVYVGHYRQKPHEQAELREQPLCESCRERAGAEVGAAFAKGLGQEFTRPSDDAGVKLDGLEEGREF